MSCGLVLGFGETMHLKEDTPKTKRLRGGLSITVHLAPGLLNDDGALNPAEDKLIYKR
jgi:hypothetical protein